ncbi:MAG: desulfoferrodoxin family protein [Bacillota bacterium]|nr:desulfoferrodoxin family protein [Bacillota bacterium]
MKFYVCKHCGNIIAYAYDAGVKVVCCGEKMQEMVPGTVDAAKEKHVPEITVNGNTVTVKVGSVTHPMEEKHYITFIALESENAYQYKALKPNEEPVAVFALADGDKAVAAYEHCNLHGLWKADA